MLPVRRADEGRDLGGARQTARRCLLCLVVLLLLAASVVGARAPRLGDSMSPTARAYLAKALQLMQEHAVHRDEIDWGKVRRTAFSRAMGARAPADTYFAIRGALGSLNVNGHSVLVVPVDNDNGSVQVLDREFDFGGRKLPGGIGYLPLPSEGGRDAAAAEAYVEQGRAAVAVADRGGACGWVIDLRRNTGGNMWSMLAVAGPILGNGKVGAFVNPSGETELWVIEDGAPLVPQSPRLRGRRYHPSPARTRRSPCSPTPALPAQARR